MLFLIFLFIETIDVVRFQEIQIHVLVAAPSLLDNGVGTDQKILSCGGDPPDTNSQGVRLTD